MGEIDSNDTRDDLPTLNYATRVRRRVSVSFILVGLMGAGLGLPGLAMTFCGAIGLVWAFPFGQDKSNQVLFSLVLLGIGLSLSFASFILFLEVFWLSRKEE